jgi:hypothetical protein
MWHVAGFGPVRHQLSQFLTDAFFDHRHQAPVQPLPPSKPGTPSAVKPPIFALCLRSDGQFGQPSPSYRIATESAPLRSLVSSPRYCWRCAHSLHHRTAHFGRQTKLHEGYTESGWAVDELAISHANRRSQSAHSRWTSLTLPAESANPLSAAKIAKLASGKSTRIGPNADARSALLRVLRLFS